MKKFFAEHWGSIALDTALPISGGRIECIATQECLFYVEQNGVQALAEVGKRCALEVTGDVILEVRAPQGTEVYMYNPFVEVQVQSTEIFTNADKMPVESGHVHEIAKAARMHRVVDMLDRKKHAIEQRLRKGQELRELASEEARLAEAARLDVEKKATEEAERLAAEAAAKTG